VSRDLRVAVRLTWRQDSRHDARHARQPRVLKFHRYARAQRAVVYDSELNLFDIEDLRLLAARKVDFVVIDGETGDDITRVLLA
jgi:polyhydroxyalkanoate synthesis regulator protein